MSDNAERNAGQRRKMNLLIFLFWFSLYIYIPYQTTYLSTRNIALDAIGVILGIYGGTQMCLRLPIGIYSDFKKQYVRLIILGLIFTGSASALRILLPPYWGYFLGNILSGMGAAMWSSFMALLFSLYRDNERQEATGASMFYNNLGKLVSFILATLLFPMFGMKFLCAIGVASGLGGAAIAMTLKNDEVKIQPKNIYRISFSFISRRLLFFGVLALVQQGVQMSTSMSYTSQVLKEIGASQFQIGMASIIYMAATVYFSRVVSSKALKKLPMGKVISVSYITILFYCGLVPACKEVWMIWICQILAGLQTGLLFTLLTSEGVRDVANEYRATALSFFQMMYAVGMTVFPMFAGSISEKWSMHLSFRILGFFGIAGCIAAALFYTFEKGGKKTI